MRTAFFLSALCLLAMVAGCATTPSEQRPKILCPACGTELDSIYHKNF